MLPLMGDAAARVGDGVSVAEFLASEYRKAGFEVATPAYEVLLSYPQSAKLEIVGEPGVPLGRGEPPIASDPDTAIPEAAVPWNAYAPSAEVVGDVVYVNRGSAEDYDRLAKMGVDVRGRIVLARYFDANPALWLSSLGISAIVGTALYLSTARAGHTRVRLERWQIARLYVMPLCVSSFAALIKGRGFILVFHPSLRDNLLAASACTLFVVSTTALRRLNAAD